MANNVDIPGLESSISAKSSTFTDKLDALVATLHWLSIKEGTKCLHSEGEKRSELLPPDWNSDKNEYQLRYVAGFYQFELKVIRMESLALVHLQDKSTGKVATLELVIDELITDDYNDYEKMYKDLKGLHSKFKSELSPLFRSYKTGNSQDKSNQSESQTVREYEPPSRNPLRDDRPARPNIRDEMPRFDDPYNIGVGDLDPLRAGRGGGGMIFDPFGTGSGQHFPHPDPGAGIPGGLPRGAVPPGARFDPFGPDVDDNRRGPFRSGPNPDHMRPPDNFYM